MKWSFIGIFLIGFLIGLRSFVLVPAAATASTFQVSSSGDDVNEDGSTFTTNASSIWLGTGGSTTSSYTGLRFTNVNIPRGAVISSAVLRVYSSQSQHINVQMTLAAELSANSPAFSTSNKPSQRSLTGQKVNHSSNTSWTANTWYNLNEMAPIVQEVVNQAGWNSGASLSIILKGSGSAWGRKFISSWNGSQSQAPQLVVTYNSGPAATATFTPVGQATSTSTATATSTRTSTPAPGSTATFTPTATTAGTNTPTRTSTPTSTATTAGANTPTRTSTPTSTSTSTATATPTSSPGPSGSWVSFPIGPGWVDAIPHQLVRGADDRVYFFGNTGDYSNHLLAYWTNAAGLPSGSTSFTGSTMVTESTYILSVDAVYDGGQFVHVLAINNDGTIKDRPFDLSQKAFRPARTLDQNGGTVNGNYVGTGGVTGMVDRNGRLHVAYWTASNHILYRSYTYNGASDTLTLVEGPTQIDTGGSATHPILAVSPVDGAIHVAWISQAANPAQILIKAKNGASWGGIETVSSAPVWTSNDFGINIDQGPSLLITSDGVRRVVYIENWRVIAPYDYGRVHYVTNSGSGWTDQYTGSYSHDPVLATNSQGELYILGHGYPLNSACRDNLDVCAFKRNSDGSWATPQVVLTHHGNQGFDSSPSVKYSLVGQNRPENIEFFIGDSGGGYANTTLYYVRLDSSGPAAPPPGLPSTPVSTPTASPPPQPSATPTSGGGSTQGGSIQYIQSQLALSTSFVAAKSVTLPQAVTTGHTLVVAISAYASGAVSSISSVTDSANNPYTLAVQEPSPAQGAHNISLWVAQNVSGGANLTVTAHAPAGNTEFMSIAVHEYSGGNIDQSAHSNGTSQFATTGATSPTSAANEIVIGAFMHEAPSVSSPTSATAGSGFIQRQGVYDGAYEPLVTLDQTVTQINAYAASLTWNSTVTWRGVVLTLKP